MADEATRLAHQVAAKKKKSTAKGKFHRIYNCTIEGANEEEDNELLQSMLQDLEVAYKELEEKHEIHLDYLDPDKNAEKDIITNAEKDMYVMYNELRNCRSRIKISSRKRAEHLVKTSKSSVQIRRLQAPSFGGAVRDYPSFIQDFETHMLPVYGRDCYALKTCLSGAALATVQGVDNDYEEMMKRLQLKYGRPEKLVDEILVELRGLKPVAEDDMQRFIHLVEVVEGCWLDMKKLGLQNEMSHVTIVSQIEKLLQPPQLREWARMKLSTKTSDGSSQFENFLDFLLQEKQE